MADKDLLLGKNTEYISVYTPSLLQGIDRAESRQKLGIDGALPFEGMDIWTAYELSWLNARGKPEVALANFYIPCNSRNIVESKSFKLYLNSLNQTRFKDEQELISTLESDLKVAAGARVVVELVALNQDKAWIQKPKAICLDEQDITIDQYTPKPNYLRSVPGVKVEQVLYSNLLKTNCPVTGQPDWATVFVKYQGNAIDQESLLRYIISYRDHQDFHEHCVESMFQDIKEHCQPDALLVYARYTRRGGLDINPLRCTPGFEYRVEDISGRLLRQ